MSMKKFNCCFTAGPFKCKCWPEPNGRHTVRIELVNSDDYNQEDFYLVSQAGLREVMVDLANTLSPAMAHYVKNHLQIAGR